MTDLPFLPVDELWAEAEAIGKLEIDHPFGETGYRARIVFDGASRVWATGNGPSIHDALEAAIAEARRLKGPMQ